MQQAPTIKPSRRTGLRAQLLGAMPLACIGRIQWNNMVVRDRRHVTDPDEMFRDQKNICGLGTNGGNQIIDGSFVPPASERWGSAPGIHS